MTASQQELDDARQEAAADIPKLMPWWPKIRALGLQYGFPPTRFAAIASRESRVEVVLGDHGHGCGLVQIDDRSESEWCESWKGRYAIARAMPPSPERDAAFRFLGELSLKKGAEILVRKRDYLRSHFPDLSPADLLRAATAAYNTGEGNVAASLRTGRDVDFTTAPQGRPQGGNYSADVAAREEVLLEHTAFTPSADTPVAVPPLLADPNPRPPLADKE
jgi:hypothetical protein